MGDMESIKAGETAKCVVEPMRDLYADKYENNPSLSRFAIKDGLSIFGTGVIVDVEY